MKVKICGLKKTADVQTVIENGGDMIGFVFAPSKRQVSIKQAQELTKQIPASIKKVGVFVNPTLEEVKTAIAQVPLDLVQLHGEESESLIAQIERPVIKAYKADGDLARFEEWLPTTKATYILLDTPGEQFAGGSGKTFDWEKWQHIKLANKKIIIAGGLTPENVRKAEEIFQPYGVDVSSGVETAGEKDPQKIKTFLQNAKGV